MTSNILEGSSIKFSTLQESPLCPLYKIRLILIRSCGGPRQNIFWLKKFIMLRIFGNIIVHGEQLFLRRQGFRKDLRQLAELASSRAPPASQFPGKSLTPLRDLHIGTAPSIYHGQLRCFSIVADGRGNTILYGVDEQLFDNTDITCPELMTETSAELAAVANVCVQPLQCKTVQYTQPEKWFDNLGVDHVTKLVVEGVPHTEGALNDTVEFAVDQGNALGRHILLTKGKPMITVPAGSEGNPRTSENVIDVLLRGNQVALEGQEETGKSTELNIILMRLFQNLVDPNKPLKDVSQRIPSVLYHYRLVDGKIVCTQVPGAGRNLYSLKTYFRYFKDPFYVSRGVVPRNDVVLVLEMAEQERDPTFTHIPTVVAVADVELLKTFHKAGKMCFAARPPHTEAELMVLATSLFYSTDRAMLCKNLGLPVDSSLLDVRGQVEKRIQKVGPFVRKVLGSCSVNS